MRRACAALAAAVLVVAASARAQEPTPTPTPAPTLALPLHPSIEIRERYDNPELPLGHNPEANIDPLHGALAFFWSRVRIGVLSDPLPRFQAFAEIQDTRYWGEEGGTLANIKGVDLHQGWLHLGDSEKFVRVGRQEYGLGEERLFGRDDWYEPGRVFDMIRLRSPLGGGRWVGEFLYAENTNPIPDNTDEAFELVTLTRLFREGSFARVYAVEKHDSHRGPKTGNKLYIVTLGLHGHWASGPWTADVEAAGQAGENYDDNQRAAFVAGYVRRALGGPHALTLGLEFSRGSGDGDDDDGNSRNIDVLYPTRHDKYGFLDLLSLQNQRQVALTLDGKGPKEGDTLHAAFRLLGLDNPKGRWINARGETIGRDRSGLDHGRLLGWEFDLELGRQVFPRLGDLRVTAEAGYFHGAALAKEIDHVVQAYEWVITLRYRFGNSTP